MTETTQLKPKTEWYDKMIGQMDTRLMCLQNNRGEFLIDKLDVRLLKYLYNNCLTFDWKNHLLLITLTETAMNKDYQTIFNKIRTLNTRFKDIFRECNITSFSDFEPNILLYKYLQGNICVNSTNHMKMELATHYKSSEYHINNWINNNLSSGEQEYYQKFLLPPFSCDSRDFSFTKLAKQEAQNTRKNETDAIVPHLSTIRAEANLRWNQMKRLRDAFQQQIRIIVAESIESESIAEGLWFNELIEQNVIGNWSINRPVEEHEKILNFLSLWGYESEMRKIPFHFFTA